MVILNFVLMGLLGGLAHTFIIAKTWQDLKAFKNVRRVIIGAIVGFLYSFLWSDWGFPNMIMCFISGWWGVSFLENLAMRFKPS